MGCFSYLLFLHRSRVLLAVLAADNVFTNYPALKTYAEWCGGIIPSIDKFAAVSSFPEVTRLVLSFVWSLVPLQCAFAIRKGAYLNNWQMFRERRVFLTLCLILMAGAFIWITIFWIGPEITTDQLYRRSRRGTPILYYVSTSRFWLGIVSALITSFMALIFGIIILWIRNLP